MDKLPFRQVHLDFHTSECMPDVGCEFSEEDFREALILGHISSITLFAKCQRPFCNGRSGYNKLLNCLILPLRKAIFHRKPDSEVYRFFCAFLAIFFYRRKKNDRSISPASNSR